MTFFAKKVVISVFPRVSVGRIGALRRQSAATPGEGLHKTPSFAGCALCVWFMMGECADRSRCFDFGACRPSAQHDRHRTIVHRELCIVNRSVIPSEVEGSRPCMTQPVRQPQDIPPRTKPAFYAGVCCEPWRIPAK